MAKLKTPIKLGVIGGSGLYAIDELEDVREVKIKTPFGAPSDAIITGALSGVPVAFLPRHGRGHRRLPSEIPQRANIWALKSLGVETVIGVSAVGSLKEEMAPRHFVFPGQLADETKGRVSTFFGDGIVAHVGFAEPFCNSLSKILFERARTLGITSHYGGTLVCMEGPQFSTKAESEFHRRMGYSIIGMTAVPEAKLAREAQMCYAGVCLVTDYDVWKEGEEVCTNAVVETMHHNTIAVRRLLADAIPLLAAAPRDCKCGCALSGAVLTDHRYIPKKTAQKLKLITGVL
ncbi:MAG: S-methyl-5'-thioadenosine phosphorylase [Elusimicrobiales bacterium]|nr:S-methyl-5'-thioadenosine phosphorylase [Elusimicrobiales bacterium]